MPAHRWIILAGAAALAARRGTRDEWIVVRRGFLLSVAWVIKAVL